MMPQTGAQRRAGSASAAGLGSTGIGSSNESSPRSDSRSRRHGLRAKVRLYADRTMVPSGSWTREQTYEILDEQTGEIVDWTVSGESWNRLVPREDKYLACGRRLRGKTATFRVDANGAGVAGVMACGSGWVCPVCAGKIQAHRAAELGQVLAWARGEKHTLAMITFTVRHTREQSLTEVWDAVSDGWAAVTGGTGTGFWGSEKIEKFQERLDRWDEARQLALEGKGRMPRGGRENKRPQRRIGDQERFGVVGWARAVEVTDGVNGWHVHVHAVVVLKGERDEAEQDAYRLAESMWTRWVKGIGKRGFTAERQTKKGMASGQHVSVSRGAEQRLADYLAKDGFSTDDSPERIRASVGKKARKLALEATLSSHKRGKDAGRTPFQILDDINSKDPGRDLARWREFVEGSQGRLALTWSTGLRELAKLEAEAKTDEEIAAEEPGGEDIACLPVKSWLLIRDNVLELFELAEDHGPAALYAWLYAHQIPFWIPGADDERGDE